MPQTIIQYNEKINQNIEDDAHKFSKSKADIIVMVLEEHYADDGLPDGKPISFKINKEVDEK